MMLTMGGSPSCYHEGFLAVRYCPDQPLTELSFTNTLTSITSPHHTGSRKDSYPILNSPLTHQPLCSHNLNLPHSTRFSRHHHSHSLVISSSIAANFVAIKESNIRLPRGFEPALQWWEPGAITTMPSYTTISYKSKNSNIATTLARTNLGHISLSSHCTMHFPLPPITHKHSTESIH